MKIKKIELCNFRSASEIVFEFTEKLNLFIGINGSGKSTVLDALSICLSWLVKRIERENGRGVHISDSSLQNDKDKGFLELCITEGGNCYSWLLTKTAKGRSSDMESQFGGANKLAEVIRKNNELNMVLPVIAYYPINRGVGAIRPEISNRDSIGNLDVYKNALGGKANYQSFFEWFRIQDDILNEQAQSRSKWMMQNRRWIKERLTRLFNLLQKAFLDANSPFYDEEFKYLIRRFEKDETIYQEPRILFLDLFHLTDMIEMSPEYEQHIESIKYMFHKMDSLSSEYRDNFINKGGLYEKITEHIVPRFEDFCYDDGSGKKVIAFLWELFSFATLLSLWWLSDKGKRDLEHLFQKIPDSRQTQLLSSLRQIINREILEKKNSYGCYEGQELQTVTKAIEQFLPEYTHLQVKRVPRPHILIDKKGVPFNLDQLSDGEKNLIALVGDIARRLAIANPKKNKPLEGEGVILIDEIDLHLHPKWQRLVVPNLLKIFPNCQFFISTHSPQVVSHVKPESVFLLEQGEDGLNYTRADETYGMSLDRIVELVMDDESRPDQVREDLDKLFELIERSKIDEAKKLIASLKKDMKTDPDLMRAEMLIRREEMKK
ncbi:MAG: hypothetical protein BWK80_21335 [Desulfobacteraceae bacterium IS3]|nr:MAG: hypothetical protein BWK80_21335 [Desulfobacteraceae bacterium IS3]